jgi:hypothetical protein
MRRLAELFRLTGLDRRLLAEAFAAALAVRIGLSLLPFSTLRRVIDAATRAPRAGVRRGRPPVARVVWAVEVAGRRLPGTTCLARALTAHVLLTRRGYATRIHIGVARDEPGRLEAHAWVEGEGQVLVGGEAAERYTPLLALGPARR